MTEIASHNPEEPKNPNVIEGNFVKRYKERFGPDTTYQSVPTSYTLSNGFLYLDGKPIRKVW